MFSKSAGELPGAEIVVRPKDQPALAESDLLASLASNRDSTREFIKALDKQGVFIIGKNLRKQEGKSQFDFVDGPGEFWVFSSQQRASEFLRTIRIKEITSYAVLGLTADFLLTNDFSRIRLVLNPRSQFERVITGDDIAALRQVHTA